jgi:predicted O-linked N-acetylglucosamine transferase (SPINDLY family)
VDLNGFSDGCRPGILAHRPAPVQVNYLGYPGTMGAGFVDYIIVDPFVVPADQQAFFSEKPVYVPDCYLPSDCTRPIADRANPRSAYGLPERGFVFASFNNSYKITPPVFDVWMRLLRAIPDAVLWMRTDNEWAVANLRREAEARGVSPERLIPATRCPLPEHLARQRLADLFLDTLPYNAHSTAADALWAGLPVLTCTGRSFASRVAGSLLRAVGLSELVTSSLDEYEALALKLARDCALMSELRDRLTQNRSTAPLFDMARLCRHLERAYQEMWDRWRRGEPPQSFAVPAISS